LPGIIAKGNDGQRRLSRTSPKLLRTKKSKKKHDDVIVSRSPEEFAVYITNMNRFCNTLSTVGRKRKENPRWVGWEVPGSLFGGFRDGSHPAARR
jgi:hypothetical protein